MRMHSTAEDQKCGFREMKSKEVEGRLGDRLLDEYVLSEDTMGGH